MMTPSPAPVHTCAQRLGRRRASAARSLAGIARREAGRGRRGRACTHLVGARHEGQGEHGLGVPRELAELRESFVSAELRERRELRLMWALRRGRLQLPQRRKRNLPPGARGAQGPWAAPDAASSGGGAPGGWQRARWVRGEGRGVSD
jgi:hypothetical protein